jgi:hypothetical protein
MGDLEFVSGHWKRLQEIKERWSNELKQPMTTPGVRMIGRNMAVVNFSMLRTWSVQELFGRAEPLHQLADKLEWMIDKGYCPNVMPFVLAAIRKNGFKADPNKGSGERWWFDLTEEQIGRIKEIFEIKDDEQ